MKSANGIPYSYLLELFKNGENINETNFYFRGEPVGSNHYLGYLPNNCHNGKPYWVGYCDIETGFDASSAEELFEAPIFGGKSLKERWHDVYLCEIGGIDSREFIKMIAEEYPIES